MTHDPAVRAYWAEVRRKDRIRAKELGICPVCLTRPSRPDRATCQECADQQIAYHRKKRKMEKGAPSKRKA